MHHDIEEHGREVNLELAQYHDDLVSYHFPRYFLVPYLVSSLAAHRTCGSLHVLILIKCAIINAGMVLNVRQVQRAHDFLGLLDISWTCVSLGKTFLQESHVFIEAYIGSFAFRLHL
jgi:hypothetical protein